MKKVLFMLAAAACMVACGNKAENTEAVEEAADSVVEVVEEAAEVVAEEPAEEAAAVEATDANAEKLTLIDLYVKACEEGNEVEAARVAKRIHNEYEEILTSEDIERMTNASAAQAEKRAGQAKEGATKAADALKGLQK